MSLRRNLIFRVYGNSFLRRSLQEWHSLPGRKGVRKLPFLKRSWSEDEEDTTLVRIARGLGMIEDGFYVDVGANLPTRRSNTFALYQEGMRGLCVEPNLELASLFEKVREEDDVICAAVGDSFQVGELQRFNYHVYSTCSAEVAEERLGERYSHQKTALLRSSLVPLVPLRELLAAYRKKRQDDHFFLLKADTEGLDLEVLQSNDWERFRPMAVLTESTGQEREVAHFLEKQGYQLAKSFPVNQLFLCKNSYEKCLQQNLVEANNE